MDLAWQRLPNSVRVQPALTVEQPHKLADEERVAGRPRADRCYHLRTGIGSGDVSNQGCDLGLAQRTQVHSPDSRSPEPFQQTEHRVSAGLIRPDGDSEQDTAIDQ